MDHRRYFLIISSITFLAPSVIFAAFDRDLYFGMQNNSDVTALQEFLRDQGIYKGPSTGGFFTLTREAVKRFQEREAVTPAAGYFGPKTRKRANAYITPDRDTLIKNLKDQITKLQAELEIALAAQAGEATTTADVTTPLPPPPPPPPKELRVLGSATSTFPAIETSILKVGEFSVSNTVDKDVLFANFEVLLHDGMDSTANRNRRVYFLLRDGPAVSDSLISRTEYTFLLPHPPVDGSHRAVINIPFPLSVKAGSTRTISLWIELLAYVRNGVLRFQTQKVNVANGVTPEGGFNLTLTKDPPL